MYRDMGMTYWLGEGRGGDAGGGMTGRHTGLTSNPPYRPGMDRRRFLLTSLAGALAVPLGAGAQQAGKGVKIGIIVYNAPASDIAGQDPKNPFVKAFVHGLRDLGWVDGQNIQIERRSAEGQPQRLPALNREIAALNVRVIVVTSTGQAVAAKAIAPTTPIVMAASALPQEAGLVTSLAKPGGNVTGLTIVSDMGVYGKRLQHLREVAPNISRVAVLTEWKIADAKWIPHIETTARALGLTLLPIISVQSPERLEEGLANVLGQQAQALYIGDDPLFMAQRHVIADFAVKHRLPTVSAFREFTEAGGLISYGVSFPEMYRRAASFVDRILKGAKPGDLPVEQPT
jgi:putative tryptophan/tyrosine transport system substrate-binding protein